jgi:hypothetical protein
VYGCVVEGVRFPVAAVELGVGTRPGGFVGEWWKALSSACKGACETFNEPGIGFTLAWTGVLDEDSTGALIGAKPPDVGGGLIGANEELEGGGGGGGNTL